jgi:hypothetical protein
MIAAICQLHDYQFRVPVSECYRMQYIEAKLKLKLATDAYAVSLQREMTTCIERASALQGFPPIYILWFIFVMCCEVSICIALELLKCLLRYDIPMK